VEKLLDEYFRDPQRRDGLADIDSILYQISGALSVLDQQDAVRAVQHTQQAVRRFIDAADQPDVKEFEQEAQKVGALSFFIETLQLHPDVAKSRFAFDEGSGIFRASLTERNEIPEDGLTVDIPQIPQAEVDEPALPTVEAELAYHQKHSEELAMSLM